eukprot:scaffold6618_cov139-Isochrysis_galbana.AAC.6
MPSASLHETHGSNPSANGGDNRRRIVSPKLGRAAQTSRATRRRRKKRGWWSRLVLGEKRAPSPPAPLPRGRHQSRHCQLTTAASPRWSRSSARVPRWRDCSPNPQAAGWCRRDADRQCAQWCGCAAARAAPPHRGWTRSPATDDPGGWQVARPQGDQRQVPGGLAAAAFERSHQDRKMTHTAFDEARHEEGRKRENRKQKTSVIVVTPPGSPRPVRF